MTCTDTRNIAATLRSIPLTRQTIEAIPSATMRRRSLDWSLVPRPKHPDPDLEKLLRSLERQGWRVEKGKYFKAWCGPPHQACFKTVKLTPSNPHYTQNLRGWLKRSGCWKEDA